MSKRKRRRKPRYVPKRTTTQRARKESRGSMMERIIKITGHDVEISDGFHTFSELYNHRIALWIALCRAKSEAGFVPWRSKVHSDGTAIDGWFILGFDWARGKQITYHLPMGRWSETEFAHTLDKAPEWDGHTSADVLERLETL